MNGTSQLPSLPPSHRRPLAAAVAIVGVLGLAVSDWYFGLTFNSAILYSSLLLVCWWYRSVRLVWALAGVMIVATVAGALLEPTDLRALLHRIVAVVSVVASATILHGFLRSRRQLDVQQETLRLRNEALEASNRELAAREEVVARQNEALQSQAEELARQSEALRAANEELIRRERTLETMLALSRALASGLTRGETMEKVCEALAQLANGPSVASAILEHQGDDLVVRCHNGFGAGGPTEDRIPLAQSFASLVLSGGRTASLEDAGLRPDLRILQPRSGPPMASVLSVPLRAGGWPIGTLELYSTGKTAWTEEQVALAESLAAQASVSLKAAQLFETVAQGRRRLETVLRTVPFGVKVANADASEIHLNPAGAAIFGLPADANLAAAEVYAKIRMTEGGKPVPPERFPVRRVLREQQDLRGEWELELPDGRRVNLLIHGSPIRTKDGAVIGAVAAFVDITVQKELQRELDARRREAEEASVRKTRFLAAVSHDIRTPANAISLLAELIRRTSANPALVGEVPELAREMHESAMALVNLLGDVLDVARFDSGRIDVQESDVSLGELLGEEFRRMQPLAREKGLAMEFTAPAEPIRVRADRIKLSRVVGNLLGNAIKFTPKGTVRLETFRNGDGWADVRVTDTGVGIAPEHQRSIFDEFFQLSNPERDRNKGTGLGLAICKRLVDAMGGRLRVESKPGEGSTFTVSLPSAGLVPGHS
jgi:PAS domain S-box-containing protein